MKNAINNKSDAKTRPLHSSGTRSCNITLDNTQFEPLAACENITNEIDKIDHSTNPNIK
ncbi:uncharacterized protein METZ01_LOCUS372416 [marine metagenome]|uniref:Uncharacterized protein n=1 Tax=marine metagenome TaxID=408172 RepID=A0A382TCR1_9ZZZZ